MADADRQTIPEGIRHEIAEAGGLVTFARFMELALTHPSDGYYSRAGRILGPRGDFSTAPRLSHDFNVALCRLVEELVDGLAGQGPGRRAGRSQGAGPVGAPAAETCEGRVAVVELGSGEGDLARAILQRWHSNRADLRESVVYRMVEVGERLRARQRLEVAAFLGEGWCVEWTDGMREALRGVSAAVVLSNEFFDALPVHLVDVRGSAVVEAFVELVGAGADARLREVWRPPSQMAGAELLELFGTVDSAALAERTRDGFIELRPAATAVVGELSSAGIPTCLLTVDYGELVDVVAAGAVSPAPAGPADSSPQMEPPRLRGRTLRGYFRHQLVLDPYARPGRQDLTADVDFAALERHGRQAGFEVALFTTVSTLLRANGCEQRLGRLREIAAGGSGAALEADRDATVLGALLDEAGLGGAFKVMLQVRE